MTKVFHNVQGEGQTAFYKWWYCFSPIYIIGCHAARLDKNVNAMMGKVAGYQTEH